MKGMKKWLIVVPLLFCSACTTIEDFQAMSPAERAEKVCSATSASRQRRSALTDLNDRISAQETLLMDGYRVYENCQVVPVHVSAAVVDCSGLSGSDLENCQQKNAPAHTEYRRVCRQTAIPIDYGYESDVLRNLRMAREDQLEIHEQLKFDCIGRASSLSATDAYSLYKLNAEP
jgi:hypothetical protein